MTDDLKKKAAKGIVGTMVGVPAITLMSYFYTEINTVKADSKKVEIIVERNSERILSIKEDLSEIKADLKTILRRKR